jgi:hypothetical protein
MRFPYLELSRKEFEVAWPGLTKSSFEITSDETPLFNCIAYAADDDQEWWWPTGDGWWPNPTDRHETVDCFVRAFKQHLGYKVCATPKYEAGYEKVALYADAQDVPTHMARQQPDGSWKSKCGKCQDIEHTLAGLEDVPGGVPNYGKLRLYMRRPVVGYPKFKRVFLEALRIVTLGRLGFEIGM